MKNPNWIIVIIALASSLVGVVTWSYSTFETKKESEYKDRRLDRIETKVDQILFKIK